MLVTEYFVPFIVVVVGMFNVPLGFSPIYPDTFTCFFSSSVIVYDK